MHPEARAELRRLRWLKAPCPPGASSIALLTAGLGVTSETFAWLRRAVEIHDRLLVYNFVNEPMLEPFRRDSRGIAILRGMRLPETR
jgi:hypothetical protein